MNRITKQLAESIAKKLTEPKRNQIKELESQLKIIATEHYIKLIPKEVLTFFNKYPDFTNTRSHVNLCGVGLTYNHTEIDELPSTGNNNHIQLGDREANEVTDLKRLIEDAGKEYRQLKQEIEVALFGLRTFKNVQEKFPEAYEHLPEVNYNTGLAINLKDVRCKINPDVCSD